MGSTIKYNVNDLEAASQKLLECTYTLEQLKSKMDGAKGILASGWQGKAATYFAQEYMEPLKESIGIYSEMIDEFSGLLLLIKQQYNNFTTEAENLHM